MVFFSAILLYAIMVVFGYIEFSQTWFIIAIGVDIVYELFKLLIFSKEKETVPFPKALVLYFIITLFAGVSFSIVWLFAAILVDGVRYFSRIVPALTAR